VRIQPDYDHLRPFIEEQKRKSILKFEADKFAQNKSKKDNIAPKCDAEIRVSTECGNKVSKAAPQPKCDNASWQVVKYKKQNRFKGFSNRAGETGQNHNGKQRINIDPQKPHKINEEAQIVKLANAFQPLEKTRASKKKIQVEKGFVANIKKDEIPHTVEGTKVKVNTQSIIFTKEKLDQQFKYFNLTKYVSSTS
jgi:hypothetical protein